MRRVTFGSNFYKSRQGRHRVREIAGGAMAILGAAVVLLTIPPWLWKFIFGAGLVWLGVQICSTRGS